MNSYAGPYSEPSQISKMKVIVKVVNGFNQLTILAKIFILEIWIGSKFACDKRVRVFFFWTFVKSFKQVVVKHTFDKLFPTNVN